MPFGSASSASRRRRRRLMSSCSSANESALTAVRGIAYLLTELARQGGADTLARGTAHPTGERAGDGAENGQHLLQEPRLLQLLVRDRIFELRLGRALDVSRLVVADVA